MIRIRPSAPLGRYPQLLLCGQDGIAPINSKIRMIKRIVPIPNYLRLFPLVFDLQWGEQGMRES
jgi:hypothetical protein